MSEKNWMLAYAEACLHYDELMRTTRRLAFAARTSGGVAGKDDYLCKALDEVEELLSNPRLIVT
jgi:hypothetical protein